MGVKKFTVEVRKFSVHGIEKFKMGQDIFRGGGGELKFFRWAGLQFFLKELRLFREGLTFFRNSL